MWEKKSSRELTAQELIHVEAIENRILWTTDKTLFAFIRVRGQDNSLLDEEEHEAETDRLAKALAEIKEPFQILSVPRTVDTQGMIRELQALRADAESDARRLLLDGEIRSLEELAEQGTKEPVIFFKLWRAAARGADRELLAAAGALVERLGENKIAASTLDDDEILRLCAIYAELGIWQDRDIPADIPILPGRKRLFSRNPSPEEQARTVLLEQITPVGGLFFDRPDSFLLGSARCRCCGVTGYPSQVGYAWAVKLMNATDCVTCVTYTPGSAEMGDALSRSIRDADRKSREERDTRRRKSLERKVNDAGNLIDEMDGADKSLGLLSIVVMPYGQDDAELEENVKEAIKRFSDRQMKVRPLTYLQREAFCHLSPYYPAQQRVQDMLQRIFPLETFMGGYPCTVGTLRDDHGVCFARTLDRKLLSLDIRHLDKDRTNGHGIVTGVSGVGKSTMLKSLLESEYMQGMKVIVIDPEREFRDLCKALGGVWWDAGGGAGRSNLLQIQAPIPDPEAEDEFRSTDSPLSTHIQHIKTVLRYKIPSLTDIQMELLEVAMLELYGSMGITLETAWDGALSAIPAEDYPIMEDLHRCLEEHARSDPRYADLALLLRSMAVGSDSVTWNGHTNLDLRQDLVVIDTNRLNDSSNRNRPAQYYNLLHMIFSVASADREVPYLIIADEAQTVFDPELPQAAREMKTIALRGRKYEVYLWMAFHSLHELMDERVRFFGQPVLDTPAYKILFGTDGQNLADTVSLFHLTAAEEKMLRMRQRGKALAMIGSQHLRVRFDIPAYKLALMGKGGGR